MAVAVAHRAHEIEAGRVGVAGLDAVNAFDAAKQAVVIANCIALVNKGRGAEVAIVTREAILDRAAERSLIARAGDLIIVRQARGVAIDRLGHAERARLAGHQLGEFVLVAGDRLRNYYGRVIGRARDEALDGVLDFQLLAGLEAELGRRL